MQMLKFCIWNYNKKVQQASNLIGSSESGKIYEHKKFEATLQEPTSGLTLCHAVLLVRSVSPSLDLYVDLTHLVKYKKRKSNLSIPIQSMPDGSFIC